MKPDALLGAALEDAWHPASARASLERWLQVCEQEGWGETPQDLPLLARVFGASWYFTRFAFYRGAAIAPLIDSPRSDFGTDAIESALAPSSREDGLEGQLHALRLAKNELMLQILLAAFRGALVPAREEAALTRLAQAVIGRTMTIFGLHAGARRIAVLGMGRLAGEEMTFGSDLDLIFLFEPAADGDALEISRRARRFLRHISAVTPAGSLYDIDMRLRPHGTAGALVTSASSFVEYHADARETWERQMMTRCRPVYDPDGLGRDTMGAVLDSVYAARDAGELRRAIRDMRLRVERERGRPPGRHELKRGPGGIMDVDFICHFLQLGHGPDRPALRTCSTRAALHAARDTGVLNPDCAADLLEGYEFLRRVERCLRLFDVRSASAFAERPGDLLPLARAAGFGSSADGFLEAYRGVTARIRARFDELV